MPALRDLPKKKQVYVKQRLQGLSKRASAIKAGYSPTSVADIETPNVKAVFQQLCQSEVPMKTLAKRLAEGLDATKTEFFQKDGVVTDQRDVVAWSERRAYLELAAEYAGYVAKDSDQAAPGFRVNMFLGAERERPAIEVESVPQRDPSPSVNS
jgi:phage terminase small subunit